MKRLLFFLILALALSAHGQILSGIIGSGSAAAGCSPTSTFPGTNGQSLAVITQWTISQGTFVLDGASAVSPTAAGSGIAYWNACSPTNAQHAQVTISVLPGSAFGGPVVRAGAGANTGYRFVCDGGSQCFLQLENGGAETTLATYNEPGGFPAIAAGGKLKVSIDGANAITCFIDKDGLSGFGSNKCGTVSDSTLTTGKVGIAGFGTNGLKMQSFAGGDGV